MQSMQTFCQASGGGYAFDLSALALVRSNWIVDDPREGGKFSYQLNVCHSIVHQSAWPCDPFAGACQFINGSNTGLALGYPSSPTVEMTADGEPLLVLQYYGGDLCHHRFNRSMRVEFTCPYDASGKAIPDVLGDPVFLYESPSCEYVFGWRTSAACPIGTFPSAVGSDCQVVDSVLGLQYNLGNLGSNYVSVDAGEYTYLLSVCGVLVSPSPPKCIGKGACQTKPSDHMFVRVAGEGNSNLYFDNGVLSLNYSHGDICHTNGFARSTLIHFVCSSESSDKPVFVQEIVDTCTYVFMWFTRKACGEPTRVECVAADPEFDITYDLTPLMNNVENYITL